VLGVVARGVGTWGNKQKRDKGLQPWPVWIPKRVANHYSRSLDFAFRVLQSSGYSTLRDVTSTS